ILNWLQPLDVRALKGSRSKEAFAIELTVPAALPAGSDLVVELASRNPVPLTVELESAEGGPVRRKPALTPGDDGLERAVFPGLEPAAYRGRAVPNDPRSPGVPANVLLYPT